MPPDCREIACFPFGAADKEPLPWFLPEPLTEKQRNRIEHYRLSEQPLPPDLAAAVRTLDATNDPHPYVAFRDRKIWVHWTPVEAAARAAGVKTLHAEEAAALPPEARRCPGRRPLPSATLTPKKPRDWWRVGSVAFSIGAVVILFPLGQALILLIGELSRAREWDLSTVMMGRGGGGLAGLEHLVASVFWLGATISLFALVAGLLRVLRHRAGGAS